MENNEAKIQKGITNLYSRPRLSWKFLNFNEVNDAQST